MNQIANEPFNQQEVERYSKTEILFNSLMRGNYGQRNDFPYPSLLRRERQLGHVCMFYFYVNTPPLAVGKPGTKIAESVIRANGFNSLPYPEKRQLYTVEEASDRNKRLKTGDVDISEPTGNLDPRYVDILTRKFMMRFSNPIDMAANRTIEMLRATNPAVLTKGRQTWDPINNRSVPAADAYRSMDNLFFENLGAHPQTCYEWIQFFFRCMNLPKLTVRKRVDTTVQSVKRKINSKIMIQRITTELSTITYEGDDVKKILLGYLYSFCGYLKSKERNKLNRRAIASPNIVLRMFLYITEFFHLELSNLVENSTISIGGEEKRKRISSTLSRVNAQYALQGTEDATKWNECLSAECFYLMAHYFFDATIRNDCKMKEPTDEAIFLKEIMCRCAFILHKKTISLGEGHLTKNKELGISSRFEWREEHMKYMNQKTLSWFIKVKDKINGNMLEAPFGMLMGMLNAGSTTWGVIGSMGVGRYADTTTTVRSSDDSMSVYTGSTREDMMSNIKANYITLKMMGINLSEKKTRIYTRKFGEYTSWYQDGDFVSQYGVETSSMRPSGMNPADDFYNAAKGTFVRLRENKINPVGALAFCSLSVRSVRRLWKTSDDSKDLLAVGVDPRVILLGGGGLNPWDGLNCHLAEMPLREYIIDKLVDPENRETNLKYIQIAMDPKTIFSLPPITTISYNPEIGRMEEATPEIPRNLYNYQRRSNNTLKAIDKTQRNLNAKIFRHVEELFNTIKPISAFKKINSHTPMNKILRYKLNEILVTNKSRGIEENPDDLIIINKFLNDLEYGFSYTSADDDYLYF